MMFNIVLGLIIFYVVIIILHFSTSIKLTSTAMIACTFSSVTALSTILIPLIEENDVKGALLGMLAITIAVPIIIYQIRSCCQKKESDYETLKSIRDILIGGTICNGALVISTFIYAIILIHKGNPNILPDNLFDLAALPFTLPADLFSYDKNMAIAAGLCFGLALYIMNILLVFSSTKILYAPSEKRNILRALPFCFIANFVVIIILLIKTAVLAQKQNTQNIN